ncbi:MAG: hypothetical protein PHV47_01730 [Candidatus Pacebacteria bacterium]|nr:hypothetical protein [Candidatus Paceibacterota bacterium]
MYLPASVWLCEIILIVSVFLGYSFGYLVSLTEDKKILDRLVKRPRPQDLISLPLFGKITIEEKKISRRIYLYFLGTTLIGFTSALILSSLVPGLIIKNGMALFVTMFVFDALMFMVGTMGYFRITYVVKYFSALKNKRNKIKK